MRAVARIQERNLTHNDIKIANIFLTKRTGGEAVLADFEMCKEDNNTLTERAGWTEGYLALEREKNKKEVTLKTDMFSVGVVLTLSFYPLEIDRVELQCVKNRKGPCKNRCQCPPAEALSKCKAIHVLREKDQQGKKLQVGVFEIIEKLLSDKPDERPLARELLEGKQWDDVAQQWDSSGMQHDTYFSRVDDDTPLYWMRPGGLRDTTGLAQVGVVPIRDLDELRRLTDAVKPRQHREFGCGIDKGRAWQKLGFTSSENPDSDGHHRLVHPRSGEPTIEVKKAWRVQNKTVWTKYSHGIARVIDSLSRGAPIHSDDLPTVHPQELERELERWPESERPAKLELEGSLGESKYTFDIPTQKCISGYSPLRPRGIGPRGPLEKAAHVGFMSNHADAVREDVNEAFLLHGVPKQSLNAIIHNGLDERYAGGHRGTVRLRCPHTTCSTHTHTLSLSLSLTHTHPRSRVSYPSSSLCSN